MQNTHIQKEILMAQDTPQKDELFLVDGSGFIFRAYHALPPMSRPDGTPVNAVLGFTNMLVKLITDMNVPNMAIIFDAKRKNFRNDIYAEYKANRDAPPEDLRPQFALIHEATEAFALPAIKIEGFEADDIIATYARIAEEEGRKVTIVSSDKDLMQLVTDNVRMFDPMKSKYIGKSEVVEKFGVTPNKVIDVQALAGDSVDNVPGVPGIGVKIAAQLIEEYGDLESLLSRAEEIKQPKRRQNLVDHANMARISKQLVALDQHVDVPLSIQELELHEPDHASLLEFLKEQGFRSTISRLERTILKVGNENEAPNANASENTKVHYELVQDTKTLQKWIDRAYETGFLAVDTETTGLTPSKADLVGICLSTEKGNGCYIPLGHKAPVAINESFDFGEASEGSTKKDQPELKQIPMHEALSLLDPVLNDPSVLKIGHNFKYDMQMFLQHNITVSPVDDTMLLSYSLDGATHSHGMDNLSELYLGHSPIKFKEVCGSGKSQITFDLVPLDKALDYAAEDADITLQLHQILKPRLALEKMVTVYETIERPLAQVIAQMEFNGIKIDPSSLRKMSANFATKLTLLEEEVYRLAGHSFNIASPKQLGTVLFEEMGLEGGKKTKTGSWSTAADVLEKLAQQGHEIIEKILEWRQISKLKSTYTDALPVAINPKTGRLHSSFHMALTNTGRLSSSDPNLQNIPIRTEDGRKIREAFIPEQGYKLLAVDYSQVELRLVAELAGIKALKQAFLDNVDIHSLTASQVFNIPLEEMTPEIRRQAKAINFGIIYGISGFGLSKQLGCSPKEAHDYIKQYLDRFPELNNFMETSKEFAQKHGYVKTFYGRKCIVKGINDKNAAVRQFAERQAINAPLQGTAADIMKRAMIALPPALKKANLKARMLLQVHDELLFEVPIDETDATEQLVKDVMEAAGAGIGIPLVADAGWGDNWAQAH